MVISPRTEKIVLSWVPSKAIMNSNIRDIQDTSTSAQDIEFRLELGFVKV